MLYMRFFFVKYIGVFVLCIGLGMLVFVKNNYFQTDMIESTFILSLPSIFKWYSIPSRYKCLAFIWFKEII